MNDQARALVADLRAILKRHPRARAIDAHAGAWLQVHIAAVDDAAVDTFAAELELGPPERASHEGVSWYRAASSEDDASITVLGPQGGSIRRGGEVGRWRARADKAAPLRQREAPAEPPMSAMDPVARLRAIGGVLARRRPAVLAAMIALLEAALAAANLDLAAGRMPTAPVVLTAEQVLEAARARGVSSFAGVAGERRILLASLGLDLTDPRIRAALVEMHQRGELHLARIDDVGAAHADLAARGLRIDLVEESAVGDGAALFHVVVVS